jgi:hypothetical protein
MAIQWQINGKSMASNEKKKTFLTTFLSIQCSLLYNVPYFFPY